MNRPVFLGLGLLASVLVTAIVLEVEADAPRGDPTGVVPLRHAPLAQARGATEDPVDRTDEWVDGVLARPLFSRDRKPTAVEAKAGGDAPITSMPRLSGVMVGAFGKSAIFAAAEGGKPQVVEEGGTIGDYTVQSIEPGRVTVAGPEGTRELQPSYDAATRTALAVEKPVPPPPQVQQPGVPVGMAPPIGRPNALNSRAGGQFQRALSAIQNAQPAAQGSE